MKIPMIMLIIQMSRKIPVRHIYYVTDKNQQGQYIRMFKESDDERCYPRITTSILPSSLSLEQRNQNVQIPCVSMQM